MAARQSAGGQFFLPTSEKWTDDKTDMKYLDMEGSFGSVAPSLRKILQMNAQTSEEKFKVLDARDKLYKMMRDKGTAAERGPLVATCPDMCPEKERLLREYQGRGSIFEMTNFCKNSNFNHSLAVKEYARSSADQEEPLPHDLRPVHVLTMTMNHLLYNVVDYCELSDENLEEWYMFMWDRTRALRKELTQQGVCSLESVTLVEQCARFHIHCAERLIDQDSSIYDDKINTENLTKCLQTLKYMYKDLAKEDIKCLNEPEFICYSLLLNLNNSSVFTELSGMPISLMNSEPVKFALDVMTTWETKNYIRFFNLVKKTTYLNCCLLRRYFGEMRLYAVKTMIRSYCTKTYSPQILLSRFVEMLNFEREEECLNFLSYCHFNFHEVDGKTVVNFDRVLFQNPSSTISSGRAFLFIEEKKRQLLSVIMAGKAMPPKLFENYIPHTSFTPNGDLKPDAMPQKELLEFFSSSALSKIESNKTSSMDVFTEREQTLTTRDPRLQKGENSWVSSTSKFSFTDKNPSATDIFGSTKTSMFGSISTKPNIFGTNFSNASIGTFGNIFDSPTVNNSTKNIFGSSSLLKAPSFDSEPKPFSVPFSLDDKEREAPKLETNNSGNLSFTNTSSQFVKNFQETSDLDSLKTKFLEDEKRREKLEEERLIKEKEEEEDRKRKEEEEAKILLELQRLQEENERKEREKKEREKKEEEERRKKEELTMLENEERIRREEAARQERLRESNARKLEELKRREENKLRIELEYKRRVDAKMSDLKSKIRKWKTKIVFDKWRTKAWTSIEDRKMKEYFKEVKAKYPPVCTEEMLDGNPYGLVIPSTLTFEKFRNWNKEVFRKLPKKLLIVNDDLPLLKVNCVLGSALENLAKRLGSKLNPFPWKLVISVPDSSESPESWKSIETFVEMHFVDNFDWQFGVQKGPLYCRGGSHKGFRFIVSIRRLRGCELHEGNNPNKSATVGSNALLFVLSECENEITRERLKAVLESRSPLPKIPVVIFVLAPQVNKDLANFLELEALKKSRISKYFVIPVFDNKHQPVVQLKKCLGLAAVNSAPPPSLRVNRFSNFFSGTWIDSLWRRVEISLSNFKIVLQEPKVLIEFYNSCIEELTDIFMDKNYGQHTVLAEEFSEFEVKLPTRTSVYENRLKSLLDRFKLPQWPADTPKSCHQLNYRIHQYCKKITGRDKTKIKSLKWVLFRIIRQSLSWKGLDIYCNDDIHEILANFPWIQVFQEITRLITRQLCEEVRCGKEVTVIYDLNRVEKFNFEPNFIGKFLSTDNRRLRKYLSKSAKEEEAEVEEEEKMEKSDIDDLSPCLEKDSVVYAYSAAIEREANKRKREEYVPEGLDALFSTPGGKRMVLDREESKEFDLLDLEANFQSLNDRLDKMKKQMMENFKILTDIQSSISYT